MSMVQLSFLLGHSESGESPVTFLQSVRGSIKDSQTWIQPVIR
jgi:hypothetical protein